MKAQELISTIRNNFEGCDLLLSLFISALHTYRVDNCLRPFPRKYYASNGEKNIDELVSKLLNVSYLLHGLFREKSVIIFLL